MSPQTLRITARRDGFRRCGIAHPARAVDHPAGRFTAEERARLMAEPELVVELIETEGAEAGDASSAAGAGSGGEGQPVEVRQPEQGPGEPDQTSGPVATETEQPPVRRGRGAAARRVAATAPAAP